MLEVENFTLTEAASVEVGSLVFPCDTHSDLSGRAGIVGILGDRPIIAFLDALDPDWVYQEAISGKVIAIEDYNIQMDHANLKAISPGPGTLLLKDDTLYLMLRANPSEYAMKIGNEELTPNRTHIQGFFPNWQIIQKGEKKDKILCKIEVKAEHLEE